jgi:hypothetical protein
MKHIQLITIALLSTALLSSCNNWLDITPEGNVDSEKMFEDEVGYEESLAGVYQSMGSIYTYGQYMITVPDAMAQYWLLPGGTEALAPIKKFDFEHSNSVSIIDNIWKYMYTSIANDNLLLQNLKDKGPLDESTYRIIRGEALGLRAYMHLDLLRLFGPQPGDSDQAAIPYRTEFDNNTVRVMKASEVLAAAEKDLLEAYGLLTDDPIKVNGRKNADLTDYNSGIAENFRGCRMNYYAVCATLARLFMWKGDKATAAKYAQEVIDATNIFHLVKRNELQGNYLYQCEIIFGLYLGQSIQNQLTSIFGGTSTGGSNVLTISTGYISNMFSADAGEGASDDYRNQSFMWNNNTNGVEGYATNKYLWAFSGSLYAKADLQPIVPMLRLSEMYYIVAEANADQPNSGVTRQTLNTLRKSRNLSPLAQDSYTSSALLKLIQYDARREFIAEGQLFFFYKRLNQPILTESGSLSLDQIKWNFPLPQLETEYNK